MRLTIQLRYRCFHTTMVLTQPTADERAGGQGNVSIPLWFLRNFQTPSNSFSNHPEFPYHYGSYATAFITKILYRFWVGRINQMGRSRKRHRIYISAIRLDLILDGRSTMWWEKAPVSSQEDRSQKIPARHSPAEAYRRKALPISLSIKWPILSRICVNCIIIILNRPRSVIRKWVQRKMVYDRSDEKWWQNY